MINNTLLLVDDDVDDAELLTEGIHSVDHTIKCHVTHNGAEALTILQIVLKKRKEPWDTNFTLNLNNLI